MNNMPTIFGFFCVLVTMVFVFSGQLIYRSSRYERSSPGQNSLKKGPVFINEQSHWSRLSVLKGWQVITRWQWYQSARTLESMDSGLVKVSVDI
jgi:hypothetical protein